MAAERIDGKAFAAALRERIAAAVPAFSREAGRKPGLAVVLVGNDPASEVYVRSKGKATVAAGMKSFEHKLDADIGQESLIALIHQLNEDEGVDGILVQLPLPDGYDEGEVVAAIDPAKDVDGLTAENVARLANNEPGLRPCTPWGCMMLLHDRLGDDLSGLDAVIMGRSQLVGRPMAQLLVNANCTVTIAHSRTRNLEEIVRRADIVVAAVGRPEMVRGSWLKDGAVVVDVGINRLDPVPGQERGRLVGDVAYEEADHVKAITPVPGGVGPMTIAVLLRNTLVAAHRRAGLPDPEGL
ncbi:MAG: bifunctional methylenetetrahydrofolate dehydrogenase/methenyltetrahydrofolate cyclohydrolase FolD [Parasphingopyxis sp.]|uniref:bifunctional methylenetetrahydrofolate dehydrogenase/methenyltetrahydrofolate cyclohydrolase FolD n=1 Tax=Parasphingopyxis sp. TaxID=1920299 RepID=UPI0032EC3F4B